MMKTALFGALCTPLHAEEYPTKFRRESSKISWPRLNPKPFNIEGKAVGLVAISWESQNRGSNAVGSA
jgi:hypothetical protein